MISVVFLGFSIWLVAKAIIDCNEALKYRASKCGRYDESTNTFHLSERNEILSKMLKIKEAFHYNVVYKPETYVYTGMSVGGISTGEVNKHGGYDYISSAKKTGKYQILFNGKSVDKIKLPRHLVDDAKNAGLGAYITEDEINVKDFSNVRLDNTSLLNGNSSTSLMYYAVQKDMISAYPTYEKCSEIINWLCGYNN